MALSETEYPREGWQRKSFCKKHCPECNAGRFLFVKRLERTARRRHRLVLEIEAASAGTLKKINIERLNQ